MVHSPNLITPPPPTPRQSMGKPTGKKTQAAGVIPVCIHTFFFNPNTKPIIETVGKRHFGSQGRSGQSSNTKLLCFEFEALVELLSDTVLFVNLHHFLGIYPTFLGNIRHYGENFTPIYTIWVPGAEKPLNPPK